MSYTSHKLKASTPKSPTPSTLSDHSLIPGEFPDEEVENSLQRQLKTLNDSGHSASMRELGRVKDSKGNLISFVIVDEKPITWRYIDGQWCQPVPIRTSPSSGEKLESIARKADHLSTVLWGGYICTWGPVGAMIGVPVIAAGALSEVADRHKKKKKSHEGISKEGVNGKDVK
jgi:hypothetical protein